MVLTTNIDGLNQRAGHPTNESELLELHGSLFDLKCSNQKRTYTEKRNLNPNIIPPSAPSTAVLLPKCPHCSNYLRPDVVSNLLRLDFVSFTGKLSAFVTQAADTWISAGPIDLVLVIGTTAQVWPAAGYVDAAIEQGARVAMVNVDRGDLVPESGELGLTRRDWFFVGEPGEVVGGMLEPVLEMETEVSNETAIAWKDRAPLNSVSYRIR